MKCLCVSIVLILQLPMLRLLKGFIHKQYSVDFARPHYSDNTNRKDQVFAINERKPRKRRRIKELMSTPIASRLRLILLSVCLESSN